MPGSDHVYEEDLEQEDYCDCDVCRNDRGEYESTSMSGMPIYDAGADALSMLSNTPFVQARVAGLRTYGIEMEMEPRTEVDQDKLLRIVYCNDFRDKFLAKEDGSLRGFGVEVISAPASFEMLRGWVKDLHEAFTNADVGLKRTDTCGTHVHQGQDRANHIAVGKFCASLRIANYSREVGHAALANFWAALARRETTSYAEWKARPAVMVRTGPGRKSVDPDENGHYAAISTSYHGTFEYRLFAGAVTGLQAQSALEVVEWAHEMFSMSGARKIVSVKKMLRNLAMNADKYPALVRRFEVNRDLLHPYKEALASEMASLKMKKPRVPRGAKEEFVADVNYDMAAYKVESAKPIIVSWNDIRDLNGEFEIKNYEFELTLRRDAEIAQMFPWVKNQNYKNCKKYYEFIVTDFPSDMTPEKLKQVFTQMYKISPTRLRDYFQWSFIWHEATSGPIMNDSIFGVVQQHIANTYLRQQRDKKAERTRYDKIETPLPPTFYLE